MSQPFFVHCDWMDPAGSPSEIAETSASIHIQLGDRHITRAESDFSKTVSDRVLLSAYPLGLWLAESWWRLRWESSPPHAPSTDWRLSHELPAAGGGFIWPSVTFESDGESVRLRMRPSPPSPFEPFRYLEELQGWIVGAEFERAISTFVDLVCARLADRGLLDTPLQAVWVEVLAERRDPHLSRFRRTEAILGFDAGLGPDSLVNRFLETSARCGVAAADEIAHASAGQDPDAALAAIIDAVEGARAIGKFEVAADAAINALRTATPWNRGYAAARSVRDFCNLGEGALDDKTLSGLLGLQSKVLGDDAAAVGAPVGAAVRSERDTRFLFRKKWRLGRRFEAARMLSEHLLSSDQDTWLLETDTHTARQQSQRAFAAEFLCPIASLQSVLQGDLSDARLDDAADYFQVSELIVRRQLVNNRVPGSGLVSL